MSGSVPTAAATTPVDNTTFHIRRQAERCLTLSTSRTGKLGGWSREARDPNVLRVELEKLARSTLHAVDLLDGNAALATAVRDG